jgi:hypothetical protein
MPHADYAYVAFQEGTLPAGDYEAHAKVSFTPEVSIEKNVGFVVTPTGGTTNYYEVK